jgi:hypothetical protein
MKGIRVFSVLFLLLLSRQTLAASVFIEGGLHFGGDTVGGTIVLDNGETVNIKAGELLTGSVGLIGDISENLEARGSIGIKLDGVFAENGDVAFIRIPLELMLFTKGESVSFGVGFSYHLGSNYSASGTFTGGDLDVDFDDALGAVAEVDFKFGSENQAYIGVKATSIDYETSNTSLGTTTFNGNSVGVVIGIRF